MTDITAIMLGGPGPRGPRGQAGPPVVIYEQAEPASVWTIKHGLGSPPSVISLWTPAGEWFNAQVDVIDANTVTVTMDGGITQAGTAVILGSLPGAMPTGTSETVTLPFIYEQTTPAAEWRFNHELGRLPASVTLYNEAGEKFAAAITATTMTGTVKMDGGISTAGKVIVI